MPTGAVITLVALAIVLVIVVVAFAVRRQLQRKHLRERFGPEYDREVEHAPSKRRAERELAQREAEHEQLSIRPLSDEARVRYTESWNLIQQQFVDRPADAVVDADRLLAALMADRGYPTGDHEQQAAALSVKHSRTIGHYRTAHDVVERHRTGQSSTEDLREAMVHYRTVFDELLLPDPEHAGARHRKV
ncbi:hypothetical protein [Prauserella endophytica]|uniref:Secreted protein n=1 Tax=Prauserella endophytica TaxID=1592324 RepID=A0ABY2RZZ9_9PSEU|nr:hypothetical protein [Prauserella endophytica]TKG66963.1 hypothetical protein FCN18_23925 [Prauserella endophytica]